MKPVAFVVMPFSSELEPIYRDFVQPTLHDCGFEVRRADELTKADSILKDIIRGIASATLIVADLTGNNPNVFYELGIAHARGKPSILLTQDVDSLPFDLRAYRVIPYNTHFLKIQEARNALQRLAKAIAADSASHGNPVSDYWPAETDIITPLQRPVSTQVVGYLDLLVSLQDGTEQLTTIYSRVTDHTATLGESAERHAQKFKKPGATPRQLRDVARAMGHDMAEYRQFLSKQNAELRRLIVEVQVSMEAVLQAQRIDTDADRQASVDFLASIQAGRKSLAELRESTLRFAGIMRELPAMETGMMREAESTAAEVEAYAATTEQVDAMFARSHEIIADLIRRSAIQSPPTVPVLATGVPTEVAQS